MSKKDRPTHDDTSDKPEVGTLVLVDRVKVRDLCEALDEIALWARSVRNVLGRLGLDTELPEGIGIPREPLSPINPRPRLDKYDCTTQWNGR
jgi:hypothetical protein